MMQANLPGCSGRGRIRRWGIAALLAAIIGLIAWLRLREAAVSLVYDELASLYFAGQPWRHLWGWWMLRETNPPLFYALLKLWRMVVPATGLWWLRLPMLVIGAAYLALLAGWVRARMGWAAALLALLLFAVSPSDIYMFAYLRAYGLARLLVLAAFLALLTALEAEARGDRRAAWRGWAGYALASIVAIHCHTTMLLWPVVASLAVAADMVVRRAIAWRTLARLLLADLATALGSGWVIVMTLAQLHDRSAANIAWLVPLGWADFLSSVNLQLLTGGVVGSGLMLLLMIAGLVRGWRVRAVRLSGWIAVFALIVFKAADRVHPVISDYTLHWCAGFTVLLAAAALVHRGADGQPREDPAHRVLRHAAALAVLASVAVAEIGEWVWDGWIVMPQDMAVTVETVARTPGAALLASHESDGVVIEQACGVAFGSLRCPFPLVVMTDPRKTDNWAFGGYHGALIPPDRVRAALGGARTVFAFSRYYYTPLQHLGLDPARWNQIYWDDGELIGPIPVHAFDPPGPGEPRRVPDPDAQYTGAPEPAPDAADEGGDDDGGN